MRPLDELYFSWLYSQVGSVKISNPSRTYWGILRELYTTEFFWIVPNDDNRAEDGKELRYEFLHEENIEHVDEEWLGLGCSMLEMMIGLSRRLSFEDDGEPRVWFWALMGNLGLDQYTDTTPIPEGTIYKVLGDVIWRTYDRKGRGGLFPLRRSGQDQTEVELWYQMSEYLNQRAS